MDTPEGKCWRCLKSAKFWCTSCQFAQYCSQTCAKTDRGDHEKECALGTWGVGPCAYCGKEESYNCKCEQCGAARYCSSSCLLLDERNHKPVCVDIQNRMLSMARSIRTLRKDIASDLTPCSRPRTLAGWGFPALDILRAQENEWRLRKNCSLFKNFSVLIFGADFKHVLATVAGLGDNPVKQQEPSLSGGSVDILKLTIVEDDPEILARLVLLVRMLQNEFIASEAVVQAMYYCHLGFPEREAFRGIVQGVIDELLHDANLPSKEKKKSAFYCKRTRAQLYLVFKAWKSLLSTKPTAAAAGDDQHHHGRLSDAIKASVGADGHADKLGHYLAQLPSEWLRRNVLRHLLRKTYANCEVSPVCVNPTLVKICAKVNDHHEQPGADGEEKFGKKFVFQPSEHLELIFEDWLPNACKSTIINKLLQWDDESNDDIIGPVYEKMVADFVVSARKNIDKFKVVFVLNSLEESLLLMNDQKFDRILTGPEHADRLGTPFLIESCANMINAINPDARLITFHSIWSQFLNSKIDLLTGLCSSHRVPSTAADVQDKKLVPLFSVVANTSSSYAEVLRQFLRAELLENRGHYHKVKLTLAKLPKFSDVQNGLDLRLVQFSQKNRVVVPLKLRKKGRELVNLNEDMIALEWVPKEQPKGTHQQRSNPAEPHSISGSEMLQRIASLPSSNTYFSLLPPAAAPATRTRITSHHQQQQVPRKPENNENKYQQQVLQQQQPRVTHL
ncbi:unnamed protein product [Notodromas monacha]|uniref:MYND-type domain-containing protein n=1 Tax=Notodromas monacha TaxID=399045 RepID=A0A7R9BYZ5_9CRUS|nr:unnamed protein product [Notodromas monacha]CAG0923411.1 unnamed protein product [Notodromas monacha]